MSEQDDGGPAFPGAWHPEMGWSPTQMPSGMSLRDWFAGQALAGYRYGGDSRARSIAEWAYMLADAMLAEREKRGAS